MVIRPCEHVLLKIGIFCLYPSVWLEEALLCWPFRYNRLLGAIPKDPRPLVPVKKAKKVDYLALAKLILARAPCESSARSVTFLVTRTCVAEGLKFMLQTYKWCKSYSDPNCSIMFHPFPMNPS